MVNVKEFLPNCYVSSSIMIIAVGRGPSGPSVEGPFCRAVKLCRALETENRKKKQKKKIKKIDKRKEK